MKICEGCINQDVCKFKKEVEKYEQESKLPEPLTPDVDCKYKRTEPSYWTYTTPTITSGTTTWSGDCNYRC